MKNLLTVLLLISCTAYGQGYHPFTASNLVATTSTNGSLTPPTSSNSSILTGTSLSISLPGGGYVTLTSTGSTFAANGVPIQTGSNSFDPRLIGSGHLTLTGTGTIAGSGTITISGTGVTYAATAGVANNLNGFTLGLNSVPISNGVNFGLFSLTPQNEAPLGELPNTSIGFVTGSGLSNGTSGFTNGFSTTGTTALLNAMETGTAAVLRSGSNTLSMAGSGTSAALIFQSGTYSRSWSITGTSN